LSGRLIEPGVIRERNLSVSTRGCEPSCATPQQPSARALHPRDVRCNVRDDQRVRTHRGGAAATCGELLGSDRRVQLGYPRERDSVDSRQDRLGPFPRVQSLDVADPNDSVPVFDSDETRRGETMRGEDSTPHDVLRMILDLGNDRARYVLTVHDRVGGERGDGQIPPGTQLTTSCGEIALACAAGTVVEIRSCRNSSLGAAGIGRQPVSLTAACAAARRATGTRKGEQLT